MSQFCVLIAESNENKRNEMQKQLLESGFSVLMANNSNEMNRMFSGDHAISVMVMNQQVYGEGYSDFITSCKKKYPNLKVIMTSNNCEKQMLSEFIHCGVFDYAEGDYQASQIVGMVYCAAEGLGNQSGQSENVNLLNKRIKMVEGQYEDQFWYISNSPSMSKVNQVLTDLRRDTMRGSSSEKSIFIYGELGVGKQGLSRMIHAGSSRSSGPWIKMNCCDYTDNELELELFGCVKGASDYIKEEKTGALEFANGGTLYIENIDAMSADIQGKFFDFVKSGEFNKVGGSDTIQSDVRIISSCQKDIQENISEGKFSVELYQQLSMASVAVPSLRERKEDVMPLAYQFSQNTFRSKGLRFVGYSEDVEMFFKNYNWPGNVAELYYLVQRVSLISESNQMVSMNSFGLMQSNGGNGGSQGAMMTQLPSFDDVTAGYMEVKKQWCDNFEKNYLIASLKRHAGNVSAAAREAKLDRSNYLRLLRRHAIKAQDYRTKDTAAEAA